jgi:hypothetical protein
MNFFKRKKDKITLHCYTTDKMVYENAPIQKGHRFFPDWWKKTPKINGENATIKNCKAIQEYYKNGIIIPSYFQGELTIHAANDPHNRTFSYTQSYTDNDFDGSHFPPQYPTIADSYLNFKILTPWRFRIDEDIQFTWTYPEYNFLKSPKPNCTLMPAVMFFHYQSEVNINYFLKYEEDRETVINFEPLEPLVIMHPITDKKIEIENHLVSQEDLRALAPEEAMINLLRNPGQIINTYKNKKAIKEAIKNSKKQCPFQ